MTSSLWQDSVTGGNLYSGVMGGVENIPPHHRQTLSISYGPSINKVHMNVVNAVSYEKAMTRKRRSQKEIPTQKTEVGENNNQVLIP